MTKANDLLGKRFGRLTVVGREENNRNGNSRWRCVCDCGGETIAYSYSLTAGRTQSCGCRNRELRQAAITKHGGRHTELYQTWCRIKTRCYNDKYDFYERYGGRGIFVCEEWINNFSAFRDWCINNGFKPGLQIDRINNNKGYSPGNCKWSTRTEQIRNRSNTVYLDNNNETKPLMQWCEERGVKYKLAYERYKKGWGFERIFK